MPARLSARANWVCACERAEIPVEAQRRRTIVKVRGGFAIELCARVGSTVDARPRPHVLIVRRARLRVAGGALNTIEQQPQQKEGGRGLKRFLVSGGVRAGASGGMDRKDRRSALVHVTNPTSRNRGSRSKARQIGSLLNTLQLPKTNRLSCICTLIMLTLPLKHRNCRHSSSRPEV